MPLSHENMEKTGFWSSGIHQGSAAMVLKLSTAPQSCFLDRLEQDTIHHSSESVGNSTAGDKRVER